MHTTVKAKHKSDILEPEIQPEFDEITVDEAIDGYFQVMTCGENGWNFLIGYYQVFIEAPRIKNNGQGLVADLDISMPYGTPILSNIQLNLHSHSQRQSLVRDLEKKTEFPIPWDKIFEKTIAEIIARLWQPPEVVNISQPPEYKKILYTLQPLLIKNESTTWHGMGGDAKSLLAELTSVLLVNGKCAGGGLPFIPTQTNVLYLDWESNAETHRRYITAIEAGLKWDEGEEPRQIHYLQCTKPLREMLQFIRAFIIENDIGLVIIDSMMAATAENPQGMTEAAIASEYYNNLSTLGCTNLTIDHITKAGMLSKEGTGTPYGSVVKFNRSRNQFEIKKSQEPGSNIMELAISHKKNNTGQLIKPFGIRAEFTNNENDELVRLDFSACDIKDNPELAKTLSVKLQMIAFLKHGMATVSEMAEALEQTEQRIRTEANRHKNIFTKVDGNYWGLLERDTKHTI